MFEKLYKEDVLLVGNDAGNMTNKTSFLNLEGNIESFGIATVIAPAEASKVQLKGNRKDVQKDFLPEEKLHVRIKSNSLPKNKTNYFYYVGEYAKDKADRLEPGANAEQKYNNELHIVSTLTSYAIAAVRSNKTKVVCPYSGGLPIEEFKKLGEDAVLQNLIGEHEVEFLDGHFEGKTVTLNIDSGEVNVEGVTSILALLYDIKNGDLVETPLSSEIGDEYALGDLGGGTTDKAVFDEDGLNASLSTNSEIGTNKYIDLMLQDIKNHPSFKELVTMQEQIGKSASPYRTREEFMRKVIKPEVEKMIDDPDYVPSYKANWLFKENIDITDIVNKYIQNYFEEEKKDLMNFYFTANVKKFILVGGGLLFAYQYFRNEEVSKFFIYPPDLRKSPYTTSIGYLISNYLNQLEKIEQAV